MIKIKSITKSFVSKNSVKQILAGVSFDLPKSSFTTIFGPNGCGKSTLVNIVAGIDRCDSGSIDGHEEITGNVGYVFQDYRRSLLPWYSVEENILFPLSIRGIKGQEASSRLAEIIQISGVSLDLKQKVYSLSGGQAQAVCILRALIIRPKLLILDEPFAALDYERTIALRNLLSNVARILKLTVLFISHDIDEAITMGDQVVFLSKSPSQVVSVLPVSLSYPRTAETSTSIEFLNLKQEAIRLFENCLK